MYKFSLAKRLTEKQKKDITLLFKSGRTIESISKEFNFSKLTITRNIKKELGDKIYKESINNNKKLNKKNCNENKLNKLENHLDLESSNNDFFNGPDLYKKQDEADLFPLTEFVEISPLNLEIENAPRKELSSIPIEEIQFPNVVYMVVDKNIELEIKLLKDYPEWEFLPNEDLKRKAIEIYFDLKTAKRACGKEQKVIKVPNTDVFRIVSPSLISRGISRIVSPGKLIAL